MKAKPKDFLLFQHDEVLMHKAWSMKKLFFEFDVVELNFPAQKPDPTPSSTFGINWNADSSRTLLWLNWSKGSKIPWRAFSKRVY